MKRIAEAAQTLQGSFPVYDSVPTLPLRGAFLHANDENFRGTIRVLEDMPDADDGKLSAALVVGNSYSPSLLPELPTDLLIYADYDPRVLTWTRYEGDVVAASATPDHYWDSMHPSLHPFNAALESFAQREAEVRINRYHYEQGPYEHPTVTWAARDSREDVLGSYAFLSSPERYAECRDAYMQKPKVWSVLDLLDTQGMATLAEGLRNIDAQITFMNLTNVAEHVQVAALGTGEKPKHDQYFHNLGMLPLHEEVLIGLSSTVHYWEQDPDYRYLTHCPEAWHAFGLRDYQYACEADRPYFEPMFFSGMEGRPFKLDANGNKEYKQLTA